MKKLILAFIVYIFSITFPELAIGLQSAIAVIPIGNRHQAENEQVVSDLTNSFHQWGYFKVVERVQLSHILAQLVENAKTNPTQYADDLGNLLGVQYFAAAGVLSRESFAKENGLRLDQFTIRFSFLDVETNQVLAQSLLDDFSIVAQNAPTEVPKIAGVWVKEQIQILFPLSATPVKILNSDNKGQPRTVLLDQGAASGLRKGQKLYLFRREKVGSLDRYKKIGTAEVSEVEGQDFSRAEIDDLDEPLEPNRIVPDLAHNPFVFRTQERVLSPKKLPALLVSVEILVPNTPAWMLPIAEAALQDGIIKSGYWSIIDRNLLHMVLSEQNLSLKGVALTSVREGKISATRHLLRARATNLSMANMGRENVKCIVTSTCDLLDIETGEVVFTSTISKGDSPFHTSSTGQATALGKTFRVIGEEIAKLLFTNISPSAIAIDIAKVSPQGGIERVWINIGTSVGLKSGMAGQIFMKTKFAGKTIEKEAGQFKVLECTDPDMSLVEITPKDQLRFDSRDDFIGEKTKYTFKVSK